MIPFDNEKMFQFHCSTVQVVDSLMWNSIRLN